MQLASQLAFAVFVFAALIYLHAFFRLGRIVQAEYPEWLNVRGSLSFFYRGLPRSSDPNVQLEILRIAFGGRAETLCAPMAAIYAKRIRYLLPVGAVAFVIGTVGSIAGGP